MPLTTPPVGSAPLYARDRVTGETYLVASPGGSLPLTGGTLTGPLTLAADPVAPLEASTKQYADGVRDTGFVVAAPWTNRAAARPAGAFKQGNTVTVHGTLYAYDFAISAGNSVPVGTVSAGFLPTGDFIFPVTWSNDGALLTGYGTVMAGGSVRVACAVAFQMFTSDWVAFNATYTLD